MNNPLYPIFLQPKRLQFLIVGGGNVGTEKLENLLRSSPDANILLVSPDMHDKIISLASQFQSVKLIRDIFRPEHLRGVDIAILATNHRPTNLQILLQTKAAGILTNVADTPDLCDFYMCSVVTKGELKIGISTNGKSPTFAKRFRQLLEEILPDNIPEMLQNLRQIRDRLGGDFHSRVNALNELTKGLLKR